LPYSTRDFNNDGRTDVLLNGYSGPYARNVAFLFKNTSMLTNTAPQPPTGINAQVFADSVQFSWLPGSDAQTPAKELSYNLYVKGSNGHYYIFPNANSATGVRLVNALGNAYQNVGWKLKGLPPGDYSWSVQTIDAAYAGSAFAPEGHFTIAAPFTTTARIAVAPADDVKQGILVYPNPVKDHITIQCSAGAQVVVHDVTGRVVYTGCAKRSVYSVDMSAAVQGVYFVQVRQSGEVVVRKVVKE
jgi:hypothetical protein